MRFFKNLIYFLCAFVAIQCFPEPPQPYATLHPILPELPFGWYSPDNRHKISEFFANHDIRVVVEVGSWVGGGSTRHMGELLKRNGGKLYAVDTWLGNTTQQPGQPDYQPFLSYAYEQFLSNMIHWDLTNTVIPCKMSSAEAAKTLKIQPDLIYIDAEHTYEAVYEDLTVWYPFVKDRGILCGDDFGSGVQQAVEQFAAENYLIVEFWGPFWRLRKP